MAVRFAGIDLLGKLIIKARVDLINYPCPIAVDVWDPNRARVVNCYDNWLGPEHC
jgi:hypothetical protein